MLHPFGNETISPPAQWHPEPNFRGTWSVLSSCLLTMFLCVWTAVHLNLPEYKKEREQTMRKVGWLLLALIAPEMVAWNAFDQRREVKNLTRRMRLLYRRQHDIEETKKRPRYQSIASWWRSVRRAQWLRRGWHTTKVFFLCEAEDLPPPPTGEWPASKDKDAAEAFWTDVHSWYVVMGGIAFDTSSAARPFLPESRERVVLTAEGIIALATYWPHLLPRLSQGDIEDKSKSDGLAKLITCWQATWFCVQCICRLAQGLSISLLELNVFGHAICALLIYVLWWTKPKDICEPTRIVGEESDPVAAWMCNCSHIGSPVLFYQKGRSFRWAGISGLSFTPYMVHDGQDPVSPCRWYSPGTETVAYYPIRDISVLGSLNIAGTYWKIYPASKSTEIYVAVDISTANRLLLMRQVPQFSDPEIENRFQCPWRWRDSVRYRNKDWCIHLDFMDDLYDLSHVPRQLLQYIGGITLACGLYGGLHATAWYAPFPSSVQQLLWRVSSATVTSSGIGLGTLVWFVPLHEFVGNHRRKKWNRLLADGIVSVLSILIPAAGLWYCFCRSFLVVESFICVAHLSASDLRLPTWPSYVPHIS